MSFPVLLRTARNDSKEMKLRSDLVSHCFFNVLSSLNFTSEENHSESVKI